MTVVHVFGGVTHLPVYNLSVEGHPEYFASGILVHNCSGAFAKLALGAEDGLSDTYTPGEEVEYVASGEVAA